MVKRHLAAVLASPAFTTSKRSQEFLRFVVEESLEGRAVKERTIAVAVFGRGESYEPSADSIVRVKAVEVRRRLAAFYDSTTLDGVHIDLPPGTYVPTFRLVDKVAEPAPAIKRKLGRRWLAAASLLTFAVLTGVLWWHAGRTVETAVDSLWIPILRQQKPVLIAVPSQQVVMMTGQAQNAWAEWKMAGGRGPTPKVNPSDVRLRERYWVGLGAATGAVRFAEILGRAGRQFAIKINPDISFTDLKAQPALLLGAFSAPWSMEMTRGLRFELSVNSIVETTPGGRRWARPPSQDSELLEEDYALVTRLLASKSGQIAMVAAGMSPPGTEAAAEFLTKEEAFAKFVRLAPADWPVRNFQVVLHCKVHAQTPGPPEVVAWHVW